MPDSDSSHFMKGTSKSAVVFSCLLVLAGILVACSSYTTNSSSGTGTVNVMLSDPATCSTPNGPFAHVYVTITDVQANVSSSAGSNDSSWVDLTPDLSNSPKQVDLLGQANNQCFLAQLGDNQELQAGTYQQIRLILADNSASISGNACSNSANCVMLTSDPSAPHALQLSSEAKTGIKIPSGQIAGGSFTIAAGQTKDLDIDFMTCESIVQEGNGQFRLKPVLHAGEVSATSSSINGKILDQATGNPVQGAVTVSVEQPDANGIDRVVMSTTAAADGTFVFCPLPSGTYDLVVVGTRQDGAFYDPTIITGISAGSTTGNVNLYLPATVATSGATLNGVVTSQNTASAATSADVQLSVLETAGATTYTIPLPPTSTQNSASIAVETAASTTTLTCPSNTDCASYSMQIASGGPYVGAWAAANPVGPTQSAPLAAYVVDGIATVPSSNGATSDCSPSELQSAPATALTGTGPFTESVPTLGFVSCQ
ncbi:MAG TPA: DUF4382 domain-containing protein [Terracidiphilus sp.]|nr:DUF4382 domain-containing protein [Terracidiphilus sp.]